MNICEAIAQRSLVTFTYDDHHRVVQPAAYGTHKTTQNHLLRGYQVGGTSSSGTPPKWELYRLEKMVGVKILGETFEQNPPYFNPDDKNLNVICCL